MWFLVVGLARQGQLITQNGGTHFFNSTFIEIIQVKRAIRDSDQATDPIADMFNDAADFLFLPSFSTMVSQALLVPCRSMLP